MNARLTTVHNAKLYSTVYKSSLYIQLLETKRDFLPVI